MNRPLLFVIILLIGCLTQFASDIYAPSLPIISQEFSSSLSLLQWSMAVYMLGVAPSQLFYGILSEGLGRKGPLLTGLIIMLIGTLICTFAQGIQTLILGRLIQGMGAGASAMMWRVIFRDMYSGNQLAQYASYLAIGVTLIIPAAPAIGAYLQHYFSWRASFVFLALYTITTLLFVLYGYSETSKHHHRERLKITFIKTNLKTLMTNRLFMGTAFSVFIAYGGLFAWITVAPILLIDLAGMKPIYFGWFLLIGVSSAYAISGFINGQAVRRFGIKPLIRLGWMLMVLSCLFLLIGYLLWGTSVMDIAPMMILYYLGAMFIFPNTNAQALMPFGHIAGYAGAVYGFIQTSGGAVLSGLTAHLPTTSQLPLSVLLLTATLIAWLNFEITNTSQ